MNEIQLLQIGQICVVLFIGLFIGAGLMFYHNKKEIESLENEVSRRMICRDGEIPGQPGYWQLFAAFYYNGVSVPEYCRYVKGDNLFRIPNKICLNEDGTWRDK